MLLENSAVVGTEEVMEDNSRNKCVPPKVFLVCMFFIPFNLGV